MEAEIVSMCLNLFNNPHGAGTSTSRYEAAFYSLTPSQRLRVEPSRFSWRARPTGIGPEPQRASRGPKCESRQPGVKR